MVARVSVTSNGVATVAYQGQGDLLADLAAHLVHGFGHGLATGRLAVDLDDQVASLDAGLGRRGVVDGRDHLDEAVFGADFDAQAAEFAAGAFLQFLRSLPGPGRQSAGQGC